MIYRNKIEKGLFGWVSKIKDRMYRTITPRGYHIGQAAKEFIKGDTRDMSKFTPLENEVWARYLGTKYEGPSNLESAIYRPTKGGATYNDVVKLKDESLILSDNVLKLLLDNYKKTGKKSMLVKGNESGLGTYTISMGEDKKGKYISYYDDWDINPTRGISAKYNIPILNLIGDIVPGTHPFSVYGRRYYKNGSKMNVIEQFKKGTSKNGITINKSVPEIIVVPNKLYLDTFYPVISNDYPITGHSRIVGRAYTEDGFKEAEIDKLMDDAGYNLVTNNCADATKCVLENISGKKMNPYFFTTPGDVLSFFKKNFDIRKDSRSSFGNPVYYTNISEVDFDKIKDLEQQLLEANERIMQKQFKQLTLNKKDGGKLNAIEQFKKKEGLLNTINL